MANVNAFIRDVEDKDDLGELVEHLRDRFYSQDYNYFTITRASDKYYYNFNLLKKGSSKADKIARNRNLNSISAHKKISQNLKGKGPAPMSCLRKPPEEGKAKGAFTTDPQEINDILIKAWNEITHGNPADLKKAAKLFMSKHWDTIHHAKEFKVFCGGLGSG